MNKIQPINVDYLRADRTIESVQLSNNGLSKMVFIYNYEGVHYRVFDNIADAYDVASGEMSVPVIAEFEKESELDNFLENELQI